MSLVILFHFLYAQHVSDINISIIRRLRVFCWITTLVVLFLVRCVSEFRCGWVEVVSVLQAFTSYVLNTFRTLIYPSSGACDYSVELLHWSYCSWFDVCWSLGVVVLEWYPCCRLQLLIMDILMSETCWAHKKLNKLASDIELVFYSSTITMMHGPINISYK